MNAMSMTKTNANKQIAARHENVGERHGLALPIELEEGAPPQLAQSAMAVISGLVILLLVWANIAQVRETIGIHQQSIVFRYAPQYVFPLFISHLLFPVRLLS